MMRLPPDGLVAFAAVIDHGSVSEAARHLNLTQPAVSNRMRVLQASLGTALYQRVGGVMEPTTEGARLLPHARAVAHALERAVTELTDAMTPIRIAISEAAAPLVSPRLARISINNPSLVLDVTHDDGAAIVEAVEARRIDIGITTAAPYGSNEHLQRTTLLVDEIVLVRQATSTATHAITAPVEIRSCTILWQAATSGVRATAERALSAAGTTPGHTVEVGSTPAALASAAAGIGYCFASRSLANPWRQAGLVETVMIDLPDLYARIEVVTQSLDLLPLPQRQICEALRSKRYHRFE